MRTKFPFYKQPDLMDCGPSCLKMIAKHYGQTFRLESLRELSETTRAGSSLQSLAVCCEKIGFRNIGVKIDLKKLSTDAPLPCILHWENKHFVVLYKISKSQFYVADPAHGIIKYNQREFLNKWIGSHADENSVEGMALLLEPGLNFGASKEKEIFGDGIGFLTKYLKKYKSLIYQLVIGLFIGSILQLIFPFLTQSIVDVGIKTQDIDFIYLILIGQLFLFAGRTTVEIIRAWVLHHLSTRIQISLVSDFFVKLMKLPVAYFDRKMTGDLMQRISDHDKIEKLLTTSSINVLFSSFNIIILGAVLLWYSSKIFTIFLGGSLLYFIWVILFLKKRKQLDYEKFQESSSENSIIMELLNGMQEIKLFNAERKNRWKWEYVQANLFKVESKRLKLHQIQTAGSMFINELKNILITIIAAISVIQGELTLGMMMSISYIQGQLNSPIQQIIGFSHVVQDAKIAMERLSEIHNKRDEEEEGGEKINELSEISKIQIDQFAFRYKGINKEVLKNINLGIPGRKMTAIVGPSGSGKTTLMKALLKFYSGSRGRIMINNVDLENISQSYWRSISGVVMQEGYIFNDTIANNIAFGVDLIDREKLRRSVEIANIKDFIESLPQNYNTKIGFEGMGISTGQKQRILIARAIYKDPEIMFFDEATSALDANNEKTIMDNLLEFFKGRTSIVIAHRLSTVRNADQIVVLDSGEIIEVGSHEELLELEGRYYNLVKNQLELEKLNQLTSAVG